MKVKTLGEISLIEKFKKRIKLDSSVRVGPGDDAASIRMKNKRLQLFTTDMLIEGTHFTKRTASPSQIGHKALAVNISDIAAMGGVPRHAVVSLGINKNSEYSFVNGVFEGIKSLADKFKINIVGGDVNSSKNFIVSIALLGEAKDKKLSLRSGAKEKDVIMVTGTLGGSLKGRHLKFMPRLKEAQALVENFRINSMVDISDGLSNDLYQICRASRKGAVVYESLIPVSPAAKSVKSALADGEDFELLFTLPARFVKKAVDAFKRKGLVGITPIGQIVSKEKGINIIDRFGRKKALVRSGFRHF